jgi:ectoine hydroxylase-related dioxygenase (phytanoyl-CoA dioxygenase family)
VDEAGGSVSFIAGSHRWDVAGLDFFSQDLSAMEAELARQGHRVDIRTTRMKRGQVSFHHCRTVHGSGPNFGTEPRRSLAIHLQPGDNHHRPSADSHLNNRMVRLRDGVPDYTDPQVCPQLWPEPRKG